MKSVAPKPGSVIHYAYLWARDHARGKEEGVKDRPTLVIAVVVKDEKGKRQVLVVPITHTPPQLPTDAVAVPPAVKRVLRLDDAPSWIVTTETNAFTWPGPDIRAIPGKGAATAVYGRVPEPLLRQVARSIVANRKNARLRIVARSE